MKGISHFVIGVAAASCFPGAVQAGAEGNPLYFLLGGAFGLLPDTLDFKFIRFFHKVDMTVTPDPNRPDAQLIADAVAHAIHRAQSDRKPFHVKLNTIQLGADRWQRYTVTMDRVGRQVRVLYGPIVDTGGNPLPDVANVAIPEGLAPLACDIALDYFAGTPVDILDGPVFLMEPEPDGRVRPVFIPWHRSWTHSFVIALIAALAGACVWDPLAGAVIGAAFAAHILADQLGFLGSNLFAPFSRKRSAGLRLTSSTAPFPNFLAVWLSILLIFWNLARFTTDGIGGLNLLRYAFCGAVLPAVTFLWLLKKADALPRQSEVGAINHPQP